MLVGERMTVKVITVREDVGVEDALHMMREHKVRRLPVVDGSGTAGGNRIRQGPAARRSFACHVAQRVRAALPAGEADREAVMSSPVITVGPDTPVEEAARIMADNKIGGVPVLQSGKLVGIITETDIFKVLIEMLGARVPGTRVTLRVPNQRGTLAHLTGAINDAGGNIISLVTYNGSANDEAFITIKVDGIDSEVVKGAIGPLKLPVVDIRTV